MSLFCYIIVQQDIIFDIMFYKIDRGAEGYFV